MPAKAVPSFPIRREPSISKTFPYPVTVTPVATPPASVPAMFSSKSPTENALDLAIMASFVESDEKLNSKRARTSPRLLTRAESSLESSTVR